ncbi:hypothetical protein PQX77_015416, partial [Marasmius sp. AFHP31]
SSTMSIHTLMARPSKWAITVSSFLFPSISITKLCLVSCSNTSSSVATVRYIGDTLFVMIIIKTRCTSAKSISISTFLSLLRSTSTPLPKGSP